jgi:hypothetical protein
MASFKASRLSKKKKKEKSFRNDQKQIEGS